MHISVQNAVVTIEWTAHRAQQRRGKVENQQFFFFHHELYGEVKNCVFAASSESLKISFEKFERRLWSIPNDTTLVDATARECNVAFCQPRGRPALANQRHAHQKEDTELRSIDISESSCLPTLSLAQTDSSQQFANDDTRTSGSNVPSVGDKNARIAAILYANRSHNSSSGFSPALAKAVTFPCKQPAFSTVALQQQPAAAAGSSLQVESQSSPKDSSYLSCQQAVQIAHSSAASSAAISFTPSAQTKSGQSRSKLASTALYLDNCEVKLETNRDEASAQQQLLESATPFAQKQTRMLSLSVAKVLELETQLKEAAAINASLQNEIEAVRSENAAISLHLSAAQATILQFSKPTADASVGFDAIPPEDTSSGVVLTDCIAESQLLLEMAEQGFIKMRHRNQLLLDRFYKNEAQKLYKSLIFSKKRRVTFKSQLNIGEFCSNDPPESVSSARTSVCDSKFDATDKSQKRRKKCEGQIKWQHAEAQAFCCFSHAMCISAQWAPCTVPNELSCKGKLMSSLDLQSWLSVAFSCSKFDLGVLTGFHDLAPSRDSCHSLSIDCAREGLCLIDAASGGLSHRSMCELFFALRGCSTLRSVDFSFNRFSEIVAAALGSLLATACISSLRLSSCDIVSAQISRMQFAVPWLTELDVSNNDIRDDGFLALTVCLQVESCSLKKLNCANNSLSGLSCKMLCSVLELNSSLQCLILDDNVCHLFCLDFFAYFVNVTSHAQMFEKCVFDLLNSSGSIEVSAFYVIPLSLF